MADTSWILPVAKEAYEHRKEILSVWNRISALFGKRRRIAFTGMAGVGKTVLFDHLTGTAYKRGYSPPLKSEAVEKGKLSAPKKRIRISVIPGDPASPRLQGLDQIFSEDEVVDGVIHVVANGFIEIYEPAARERLLEKGLSTIDSYRAYQLSEELKDLDSTCDYIRRSLRRHRRPAWMLIAVTKADLYYKNIGLAENYYSPHGSSAFVERLNQLQSQAGTDNFRWDALPVCSWLEDFEWNDEKQASTLKPYQRDHLVARFAKHLEQYCES